MTTVTRARLHATRHDLPEETRGKLVDQLNGTLACVSDLKSQTKQAHWNVKGKAFFQLHELFDQMAAELDGFVDALAERATTLGGTAMGTVRLASKHSLLEEYPYDIFDGLAHVTALADRYATVAKHLREGIERAEELNDADTADLYTEISRAIDMRLWFLEAHLQAE